MSSCSEKLSFEFERRAHRSPHAHSDEGAMGGDASKEAIACCDCGFQQRNQILEATEVNGVSSMKLHENNQRFLRAMAEGGKSDLILGLFSTTREFDVNAVDENGEAALHKAARNGHVIVCHVLIKRGARADLQNNDGKTAVDLARDNNHMECVEYLQEPGLVPLFPPCPLPHRDAHSVHAHKPGHACLAIRLALHMPLRRTDECKWMGDSWLK